MSVNNPPAAAQLGAIAAGRRTWHGVERGKEIAMAKDTLTITDNRTGKPTRVPIEDGTIRAMDLRQIKNIRRRIRD